MTKYFAAPLLHLFLNRAKHGDEEEATVAIPPLLRCFTPPSPDRQAPVPMPPRHPVCIPMTPSLSLESLIAPLSMPLWRPGGEVLMRNRGICWSPLKKGGFHPAPRAYLRQEGPREGFDVRVLDTRGRD